MATRSRQWAGLPDIDIRERLLYAAIVLTYGVGDYLGTVVVLSFPRGGEANGAAAITGLPLWASLLLTNLGALVLFAGVLGLVSVAASVVGLSAKPWRLVLAVPVLIRGVMLIGWHVVVLWTLVQGDSLSPPWWVCWTAC